jgi:hypothetical protein
MTTENNFSVYRIWSPSSPLQYIGSTTQKLSQRFGGHARDFRLWQKGKYHYVSSYDLMKLDDARIELIEAVDTKSKQVLRAREGHWIRTLECVNKRIEGRQQHERYLIHRVERIQEAKERYDTKCDYITAQRAVKYDCPCGGKHTHGNTAVHCKTKTHQAYLKTQEAT